MKTIKFTTLQAPNQDFIIQELCAYVGKRLGIQTEFVIEIPWEQRERLFDAGLLDIAWICGLPYVWKVDKPNSDLELLVAPVMLGPRYSDRPVYFSDVIVRKQDQYRNFTDLRGKRWAYNEPHSQSGYNITCCHLARIGERSGFFGRAIQAGSHQASIEMVLAGAADAAAIDSTVLEIEQTINLRIGTELEILTSLGPSPIPPLVIKKKLDQGLRTEVRQALSEMHGDPQGCRILNRGNIKHLEVVKDEDYDPIRKMAQEAQGVKL